MGTGGDVPRQGSAPKTGAHAANERATTRHGETAGQPVWTQVTTRRPAAPLDALPAPGGPSLLEATGGHPYDTMQVAYYAYRLGRDRPNPLDRAVVLAAIDQTEDMLAPVFAAELDSWGARARLVLGRLAHGLPLYGREASNSAIQNALRDLLQAGVLVRRSRGRYAFGEALLERYLGR